VAELSALQRIPKARHSPELSCRPAQSHARAGHLQLSGRVTLRPSLPLEQGIPARAGVVFVRSCLATQDLRRARRPERKPAPAPGCVFDRHGADQPVGPVTCRARRSVSNGPDESGPHRKSGRKQKAPRLVIFPPASGNRSASPPVHDLAERASGGGASPDRAGLVPSADQDQNCNAGGIHLVGRSSGGVQSPGKQRTAGYVTPIGSRELGARRNAGPLGLSREEARC
jgi:hypothetical protein